MELFPRAFSFCLNEDASVADVLATTDPNLLFHLPLSTQARGEVREIQQGSLHTVLDSDQYDAWECTLDGTYSLKKFYEHCFREVVADKAFLWLWKAKCPIKFKMFGWLLLVDRLNTRNMLRRRHYNVANNVYTCMLCQIPPEEIVEHLFFACPFNQRCWAKVGMLWPTLGDRVSLLHGGRDGWRQPLFMDIFQMATWSLWKERNNKHFRRVEPTIGSWARRFKEDFSLLIHRAKEKHRQFISSFTQSFVIP